METYLPAQRRKPLHRRPMPAGWFNRLDESFREIHIMSAMAKDDPSARPALRFRAFSEYLADIPEFTLDTWQPNPSNGNTLLHTLATGYIGFAGREPLKHTIAAMSRAGLDIHHRNMAGRSALHSACFNRRADVALALIDNGASIHAADSCGDTPLHDAAASYCEQLVEALLALGADPLCKNKQGKAPWEVARDRGHGEAASTMLAYLERDALTLATAAQAPAARTNPARL